jgi:hypothetical protein
LQRDKFAKKSKEKLAKKDQDALVKTEKMKTPPSTSRRKKGFGSNDTASDKDKLMKKIKKIHEEHRAGVNELKKVKSETSRL